MPKWTLRKVDSEHSFGAGMNLKTVKVVKLKKDNDCSRIIKDISALNPFPKHLKRVKSLDETTLLLLHSLPKDEQIEGEVEDLRDIPWNEPSTTEEWREWNKLWPCEFNKSHLEKLQKQHLSQTESILNSLTCESPMDSIIFKEKIYLTAKEYKQESFFDPREHASFKLISSKSLTNDPYLLTDCIVVLTEEPCLTCAMALLHSRVQTVIYKNTNSFNGALESIHKLMSVKGLNHYYKIYKFQ
jgi:tRNA(Arg) A34 adenosine deaminase TadA